MSTFGHSLESLDAERKREAARADENGRRADRLAAELMATKATITRVESVVDDYESEPASGEMYPLWRAIRDALNGEQS